jgi:hypothetical protein
MFNIEEVVTKETKEEQEQKEMELLKKYKVDFIVLARYMQVISENMINADFLLVDDEKYLGKQPFRTYNGMKFQDGFADHLPVYVDLWY